MEETKVQGKALKERDGRKKTKEGKRRRGILFIAVFLVLLLLSAWFFLSPGVSSGTKKILVRVEHLSGEEKSFTYRTDEDYLRGALEELDLIEGIESTYGLWITAVDGETANEANQEWWGYTVNGDFAAYGVDDQPVTDGDVYVFTLNVGY